MKGPIVFTLMLISFSFDAVQSNNCQFSSEADDSFQVKFKTSRISRKITSLNKVDVSVKLENLFSSGAEDCLESAADLELFVMNHDDEWIKLEQSPEEKQGTLIWENIPANLQNFVHTHDHFH